MKGKFFIWAMSLTVILSSCANSKDKALDQSLKEKASVDSSEPMEISDEIPDDIFDTRESFSDKNQFTLSFVDVSIRSFEQIEDNKIIDSIKDKARGKYLIYVDYIFEDETIDSDFSMSSYKLGDILPKAKTKDGENLDLVFATNLVPEIDEIKKNQESVRAIFASDQKIDQVDISFNITDKLGQKTHYKKNFDIN